MNSRRRIFWWVFLPLCLLAAVVPAAITYWRHTVPLSECSEVYRQYRHQPGVRAAFIRQMPINDTLRLDMTLLEAEDSAAFAALLRKMGKNEERVSEMMQLRSMFSTRENGQEVRFTGYCIKGYPGIPGGSDPSENEIVSYFPVRMCVAVFHTHSEKEMEIVLEKSYFDEIHID